MISRRTFLKASVAAASGLILPSWLVHAERFIQAGGQPYLERPASQQQTLYASEWGDDGYELFLGNPLEDPDLDLTWQDFIDAYDVGQEEFDYRVGAEEIPPTLQDKVEHDLVQYHWEYSEFPGVKAYRFLEGKDLGPELGTGDGAGSIVFYDGFSPANDCQVVAVPDLLSLSLLQKRLNLIDDSVAIELISI